MSKSVSLLISKVNDIQVLQIGESRLSVHNRKADGSKVSAVDKLVTTIGRGSTRTIDLGAGAKRYTITIAVSDRNDNDKLFDILYNKRNCNITDKYKGKLNVYVDAVEIVDSDVHINQTLYTVNCTAQSLDRAPSVNYDAKISATVTAVKSELVNDVSAFSEFIESVESFIDGTGVVQFFDSGLEVIHGVIDTVNDIQVAILDAASEITSRVNKVQRTITAIKNIKNFPSQFVDLVTDTFGSFIETNAEKRTRNYKVKKVAVPIVRGKPASQVDLRVISGIERDKLEKDQRAAWIANKVTFLEDINALTSVKFLSDAHFNKVVGATIAKVYEMGYPEDKVADIVFTIKKFAAEQEWGEIVTIDGGGRPMVSIVYDRYGNTDKLERILEINAFKDNDNITTGVKVLQ